MPAPSTVLTALLTVVGVGAEKPVNLRFAFVLTIVCLLPSVGCGVVVSERQTGEGEGEGEGPCIDDVECGGGTCVGGTCAQPASYAACGTVREDFDFNVSVDLELTCANDLETARDLLNLTVVEYDGCQMDGDCIAVDFDLGCVSPGGYGLSSCAAVSAELACSFFDALENAERETLCLDSPPFAEHIFGCVEVLPCSADHRPICVAKKCVVGQ